MPFEYKVVPAPTRGRKVRGLRNHADRFAAALSEAINVLATEGWEYLRTDTLPSEERSGLTGKTTVFHNMLVFRRVVEQASDAAADEPAPTSPPKDPVAPTPPAVDASPHMPETAAKPQLPGATREVAAE